MLLSYTLLPGTIPLKNGVLMEWQVIGIAALSVGITGEATDVRPQKACWTIEKSIVMEWRD